MGEARPKGTGEFELDDYILELHRSRRGKSYTLLFKSSGDSANPISYRMMHSHVEPDRYVFLQTDTDSDGQRLEDRYKYSLIVHDATQKQGILRVIDRMDENGIPKNTIEWSAAQELQGMDVPTPEQTDAFRRIYDDLAAQHPISTY